MFPVPIRINLLYCILRNFGFLFLAIYTEFGCIVTVFLPAGATVTDVFLCSTVYLLVYELKKNNMLSIHGFITT